MSKQMWIRAVVAARVSFSCDDVMTSRHVPTFRRLARVPPSVCRLENHGTSSSACP